MQTFIIRFNGLVEKLTPSLLPMATLFVVLRPGFQILLFPTVV